MTDSANPFTELPLDSDSFRLLTAAWHAHGPESLSVLGRMVGMTSRMRASRAGKRLLDVGLLRCDNGKYRYATDHPLGEEIGRLLYLTTGAKASQGPGGARAVQEPPLSWPLIREKLPQELRSLDALPGPKVISALAARKIASNISATMKPLRTLRDDLQTAYSTHHDERGRDFIHALIGPGDAAQIAVSTLVECAERQNMMIQQDPRDLMMTDREWQRTLCLLEQEILILESWVQRIDAAYEAATQGQCIRNNLLDDYEAFVRGPADSLLAERIYAQQGELARLRETSRDHGLYWHGGTPDFDDVGRLGDGLVRARIYQIKQDMSALLETLMSPASSPAPSETSW